MYRNYLKYEGLSKFKLYMHIIFCITLFFSQFILTVYTYSNYFFYF